jgi:hypothetical protein
VLKIPTLVFPECKTTVGDSHLGRWHLGCGSVLPGCNDGVTPSFQVLRVYIFSFLMMKWKTDRHGVTELQAAPGDPEVSSAAQSFVAQPSPSGPGPVSM